MTTIKLEISPEFVPCDVEPGEMTTTCSILRLVVLPRI